VNVKLTIIYGL